MIPAVGRDVQCSNCSTTWFQPGPRQAVPEPEPQPPRQAPPQTPQPVQPVRQAPPQEPQNETRSEPASAPPPPRRAAPPPPAPEPAPKVAPPPEPTPEPDALPRLQPSPDPHPAGPNDPATPDPDAPKRPERRQIDPAVADILRQEAEREANLRRAEAAPDPVETQGEMPLESDSAAARVRRLAELEEAEDAFDTENIEAAFASAAAGSRRELLPDIEEINSTLRATGDRSEGEADATDIDTIGSGARRRSQSRRGFVFVLLVVLIAGLLYVYSAQISARLPQVAPYLERYAEVVDTARIWLDDMARSLAGDRP